MDDAVAAAEPALRTSTDARETTGSLQAKRSYCRICTVQCGIVLEVEGDQILKVRGDRDHPLTHGYTCPKGRAVGMLHHHPDAITQPLMRKNGQLVEVGWDECLDDLACRLRTIVDQQGPNAIGVFFGSGLGMDASGYRMAEAFYGGLGAPPKFTPMTIDGTAKLLVASLVGGFPGLNPKTDYDHVDMLVYVGSNPMVSHGHNTGMYNPAGPIRAAAARGEVWTIDPLRTETANWSSRHIAPLPGKDYAILAWLTREILEGGPLNPAQPVNGLDELRTALAGFDLATAAEIAGVAEQELTDLLAAIRRKGWVVVETGTGVTMSKSANVTQWLAWVLMILTGAMNRTGGAWFHPGFLTQFDSFELPALDNPFTPGPPTMPEVSGLIGDWPCAALPGEVAAGNIKALVNFGGAVVRSFPDTNLMSRTLEALDVCVTFEVTANDTTALSTHVLPTKDQTERPDITLWDTLGFKLSMQYADAIMPAQGERRSSWWVISELMRRMGMAVPEGLPADDRQPGADQAMLARLMGPGARCSFEELAATGYVEHAFEVPGQWVNDHIRRMGGWKLAPQPLVDQWQEIRREDAAALSRPRQLCYISRRQRRKLNASLSFLGSPADIILNPIDAEAHGVVHGQRVRVQTTRGEIVLTANVDPTIRPGVASIPHGHEAANVNCLTSVEAVDPLGGQVLYTGIPIAIAPLSEEVATSCKDAVVLS